MDILQLYQDFNIPIAPQEHKHAHEGWVHTPCPFCKSEPGHEGFHLGFPVEGKFFICWRCGTHSAIETISKLLKISTYEASSILKNYGGISKEFLKTKVKSKTKPFSLPSHLVPLLDHHKKYLAGRNFDPDKLERVWGLVSTGPASLLDKVDYGNRILIPINWGGETVSFQTRIPRDVSKDFVKYLACSQSRETIEHKEIIFGNQSKWTDTAIVVEGVFDAFRIGEKYGVATFGTSYKPAQIRLLAKNFKRIAVMYDSELIAQKKARNLVSELQFRGKEAFNVELTEGDPGSLTEADAKCLVNEIITKFY
jgi:hypothetical protein